MIKKIRKYINIVILKFIYFIFSPFIKIDNKLILFSSLNGKFSDNAKYLYLKTIEETRFKAYWVAHEQKTYALLKSKNMPVLKLNYKIFITAIKSRLFITTHNYQDVFFIKNKKTNVINLWHGTPLKKMGYDSKVDAKRLHFKEKFGINEYKNIDYLCVSSRLTIPSFKSSFNIAEDKLLPTGLPRNDVLQNANADTKYAKKIKEKVKSILNTKSEKIALYAPTFRDYHVPRFDLIKNLKEIFMQNNIELVIKLHPLDKDYLYFKQINIDIQELLIASDLLVSDYSSIFFDYAILGRPIILFLYDLAAYKFQRNGFYIETESLPFLKCYNLEQINETLKTVFGLDTSKIREFGIKYNRSGCASCRIIKLMEKITKN
ncbi:CDP-glycerol glycerophosphotransferase family protein [Desulfurella sp.]|uniref:CDP-glycerol glycerophosphotransferase family protein n=1 Tax=Desulfurella sp. TaxID=1962857 RepID=UPI003D0E6A9D